VRCRFAARRENSQELADGTISMDYEAVMMMEGSDPNGRGKNYYDEDRQQRSDLQYTA